MQITINLSDIFCDGEDPCDLQEAIKAEVVRNITTNLQKNIYRKLDAEISRVMDEEISSAVRVQIPGIIDDLINAEYTPVDAYGSKNKPTTFRNELLKKLQSEMQYKPQQYECDENSYTKTVRGIVKEQITQLKTAFDQLVNAQFIAEVHAYAVGALAKKLGVNIK